MDNIENVYGMPEDVRKGNEITNILPGFLKKNRELSTKKNIVSNNLNEVNRKLEELEPKIMKLEELGGVYGIGINENGGKKEKYDQVILIF